jgi:hypothetical protein
MNWLSGNFLLSFPAWGGLDRKVHHRWKTNETMAAHQSLRIASTRRRSWSNSEAVLEENRRTEFQRGGQENAGIHSGLLFIPFLLGRIEPRAEVMAIEHRQPAIRLAPSQQSPRVFNFIPGRCMITKVVCLAVATKRDRRNC